MAPPGVFGGTQHMAGVSSVTKIRPHAADDAEGARRTASSAEARAEDESRRRRVAKGRKVSPHGGRHGRREPGRLQQEACPGCGEGPARQRQRQPRPRPCQPRRGQLAIVRMISPRYGQRGQLDDSPHSEAGWEFNYFSPNTPSFGQSGSSIRRPLRRMR